MKEHPVWIGAAGFAAMKDPPRGWPMRALVCRIDDPLLAPFLELAPTQWDLFDQGKPLAGSPAHFLKRRMLLRRLVGLWLGCAAADVVITHDVHGAPRVVEPDARVYVSVAARGRFAALAVSNAPVGVDLERNWPQSEPVWHVLHVNERRTLEAQWREKKSDGDFLQIWMAKEAWLKAVGAGLKRDPAGIEIVVSPNGVFEVLDPQWRSGKIVGLHDALFIGDELLPVACVSTKRLPSRGRYSY